MDASRFIASRLRFKGRIASVSIGVSFLVMIVAVSISSGFRYEIRNGISSVAGDVQLTPPNMNVLDEGAPIDADPSYLPYIKELDYVEKIEPVVYRAGIAKAGENIQGVLFKGTPGFSRDSVSMPVSVPSRFSEITGLGTGDDVTAYFVGEKVKARKFRIVEVHESMVQADDRLVLLVPMADLQRLNGWTDSEVSAMEIMLEPSWRDEESVKEAARHIGSIVNGYSSESERPVIATSAISRYPQLFDWLSLIDFNVLFILVLMTVVAGVNMISGLLIMLFEHISTIGLLKALGMTDKAIARVFLSCSASAVLKGMAAGNILALLFCLIQGTTHLLRLNPENYFVSYVPVNPDLGLILAADAAAFAAIMLLLLIPCLFVARVDPADTVRYS
ncbi:MAG: ABC transporter permease [Candidatus Cryptobacteroides sp.]